MIPPVGVVVIIRRAVVLSATVLAAVSLTAAVAATPSAGASHAAHGIPLVPLVNDHMLAGRFDTPPNTVVCQQQLSISCYQPFQFQLAYDTFPLYDDGLDGTGQTIAIVDPFGSPTIKRDLHTFDVAYGLDDPPSISTITPAGPLPRFDVNDGDMTGWALETSLDVEMAHLMAPGAAILVVATPVSETEGVQGFPEIVKAENYVINHHLASVISQSLGSTEQNFPDRQSLLDLRGAYLNAARHHVTVLAASGDSGATNPKPDDVGFYSFRASLWPSTDPLVTSVGGTQLRMDRFGTRLDPDIVWNDRFGAGGGGQSVYFSRPAFQKDMSKVVGDRRGVPDISMSAAVDGAAIIYTSFNPISKGFSTVGGTSEATPLFAGVAALADQAAHQPLGDLNPLLYQSKGPQSGLVDVTFGTNDQEGVKGFAARRGYDLASGLGTVDANRLVRTLAAMGPAPAAETR